MVKCHFDEFSFWLSSRGWHLTHFLFWVKSHTPFIKNQPKLSNFLLWYYTLHFTFLLYCSILYFIIFFRFTCIRSIYRLNSTLSSLQLTMILTLRKFISLFASVLIFKNQFNGMNMIGTILVFIGTLLFYKPDKEEEKEKVNWQ